tara:strand:+ start:1385 stop:2137 length:753 start_codon:yes stop_codon:yes gene_type:complete
MSLEDKLLSIPDSIFQGPLEQYKKDYKDLQNQIRTGQTVGSGKLQESLEKIEEIQKKYNDTMKPIVAAGKSYQKLKESAMKLADAVEKANSISSISGITAATPGVTFIPLKVIEFAQRAASKLAGKTSARLFALISFVMGIEKFFTAQLEKLGTDVKKLQAQQEKWDERVRNRNLKMMAAADAKYPDIEMLDDVVVEDDPFPGEPGGSEYVPPETDTTSEDEEESDDSDTSDSDTSDSEGESSESSGDDY